MVSQKSENTSFSTSIRPSKRPLPSAPSSSSSTERELQLDDDDDDEALFASAKPKSDSSSPSTPARPMSLFMKFFLLLLFSSFVVSLVFLRLSAGGLDDEDAAAGQPPSVDYYAVLGVPRTAGHSDIVKSYRRLALAHHPDKVKNCDSECVERFEQIASAYKTLSNEAQRAMYDSVELSFSPLTSAAVDLDSSNFPSVLASGAPWVVLVYTDWHKSCIAFQPVFEDFMLSMNKKLNFGRLHSHRERSLLNALPVSVRLVPTVLFIVDGEVKKAKTFLGGAREAAAGLYKLLDEEFPSTGIALLDPYFENAHHFLNTPHVDHSIDPAIPWLDTVNTNLIFFPSANSAHISLGYRTLARSFSGAIQFAQQSVPPETDKKAHKVFINSIQRMFGAIPGGKFPAILYKQNSLYVNLNSSHSEANQRTNARWLAAGELKDKLGGHLERIQRDYIANIDSTMFNSLCAHGDASCVLFVQPRAALSASERSLLQLFLVEAAAFIKANASAHTGERVQFAIARPYLYDELSSLGRLSGVSHVLAAGRRVGGRFASVAATAIAANGEKRVRDELHAIIRACQLDEWDEERFPLSPLPVFPSVRLSPSQYRVVVPYLNRVLVLNTHYLTIAAASLAIIVFGPLVIRHFKSFVFLVFLGSLIVPALQFAQAYWEATRRKS